MTLEEIKKKFPIGTKFKPAHLITQNNVSIITNTNFKYDDKGNIIALTDENNHTGFQYRYGNHNYTRVAYLSDTKKVAEIIKSQKIKKYELW